MAQKLEQGPDVSLILVGQQGYEWPEEFGPVLREVRGDFSQSGLAEGMDINHSSVSRLESGERRPSRDMVEVVAHTQGLSETEADRLRAAAGFRGHRNTIWHTESGLLIVNALLMDSGTPESVKEMIHEVLSRLSSVAIGHCLLLNGTGEQLVDGGSIQESAP